MLTIGRVANFFHAIIIYHQWSFISGNSGGCSIRLSDQDADDATNHYYPMSYLLLPSCRIWCWWIYRWWSGFRFMTFTRLWCRIIIFLQQCSSLTSSCITIHTICSLSVLLLLLLLFTQLLPLLMLFLTTQLHREEGDLLLLVWSVAVYQIFIFARRNTTA